MNPSIVEGTQDRPKTGNAFVDLPRELKFNIFSTLSAIDLQSASLTCRTFRLDSDLASLWRPLVEEHFPHGTIDSPEPYKNYRALYWSHHPDNWFLVEKGIWFMDTVHGSLSTTRFNRGNGNIELCQITAYDRRQRPLMGAWERDPMVMICNFNPGIEVDTEPSDPTQLMPIRPYSTSMPLETWNLKPLYQYEYTPTEEYSLGGIWVGDYSAHGCEFLLFKHDFEPSEDSSSTEDLPSTEDSSSVDASKAEASQPTPHPVRQENETDLQFKARVWKHTLSHLRGRLEAVKLTGDENIPQGKISFHSPDISGSGSGSSVIGEDEFQYLRSRGEIHGAGRLVKSKGHIAEAGFRYDMYIDTELILLSPNLIAQHWIDFKMITLYRRVTGGVDGIGALPPRRWGECLIRDRFYD